MIMTNISNTSKQHLILFDIDDTLIVNGTHIYKNYKIINQIHKLQHAGVHVGISTNRSAEMTQSIYNDMCLNGPFLVEQGANLTFKHYRTIKKSMVSIRIVIIKNIIRFFASITRINIEISNNRRHTISIFVSSISNINKINLIVNAILKVFSDLKSTTSIDNQRIYIRDKNITKHSSIKILMPNYLSIYVIGDAEHDTTSNEIHYLGVYGSQPFYSNICEYNTKKSGADGIIDLLEYICTHI